MTALSLSRKSHPLKKVTFSNKIASVASASFMTKQSKQMSSYKMSMLQKSIFGSQKTNIGGAFVPSRSFSLPDHIKLEMPNLSPTMEKVSNIYFLLFLQNLTQIFKLLG